MIRLVHPVAGAAALLTILTFWLSSAAVELAGDAAATVAVKTAIPWGFLLLIPALMAAGISGMRLGARRRDALSARKRARMPVIAANGLLVLVPAALFLSARAQAGTFDAAFHAVQALELVAGAVNIALLGLNMRDGLRMTAKRRSAVRT